MQTYVTNKLLSFAAVLFCILVTLAVYGYTEIQWQAILLAIIIFGYGHFLLGFYYQFKSFLRQQQPVQYFATFAVLTLLSVGVAYLSFEYIGFVGSLFLGFLYFLLHGLFNEQTLALRQVGTKVPLLFFLALALFIISLLAYSVPDRTFFFDETLQFASLSELQIKNVFEEYYMSIRHSPSIFWGGILMSLTVLLFAWWRFGFSSVSLFLLVMIGGGSALVFVFGPPAYIYMYLFVVGYHFMTWLLFYLVEMRQRGKRIYRAFILQNLIILLPLLYAAYLFFQPQTPAIVMQLFDYKLFVVVTYVHITTSFMNDEWMQRLQQALFTRFARPWSRRADRALR